PGRLLEALCAGRNVLTIALPPLRDRLADLPRLVEVLLRRAGPVLGRTVTGLSPEAWDYMRAYGWPGNVRELYATLLKAGAHASGDKIDAPDLPLAGRQARAAADAPPAQPRSHVAA